MGEEENSSGLVPLPGGARGGFVFEIPLPGEPALNEVKGEILSGAKGEILSGAKEGVGLNKDKLTKAKR